MKVVSFALVFAALVALVVVNAGGLKESAKVMQAILIVVGGLVLMAALFALLVAKPSL